MKQSEYAGMHIDHQRRLDRYMCGITGWVDWTTDLSRQDNVLKQMNCSLQHRGPDAEGYWLSPRAALAHRRLIVIDPPGGKQPMVYTDGDRQYALTYNGELYNFKELRHNLASLGHTFQTQSDTEVLLHAYMEWGTDCVKKFNGIFAFALWDESKQLLFLARDHMGVKPLFYAQRGDSIIFGSEIKALLAHPLVKPEISTEGLAEIFCAGLTRTPGLAVFHEVCEVKPGHSIIFKPDKTSITQYWSLHSAPHTDDIETTAEHIRMLLADTVKRQLIADMPIVSLLSGGLDSSGLAALAEREFARTGKTLQTYSIDFIDSARDFQESAIRPGLDTPWIYRVADYLGTQQHTITLDTPELVENLLVPMRAHDLPAFGQIETSLYLLFKEIKKNATVSLSGESADEVFGGYPWFHQPEAVNAQTFPWARMTEQASILSAELEQRVHTQQYMERRYREALAEVPRLAGENAQAARIREIFYLNLTRFLPALLNRKDRMSMAVGLEVRVPFCDYRLVEYLWNVPWEMKTVDNIEKGILRRALSDALPDDVRYRRKSAYPTTTNPSYLQAVQKWAMNMLDEPNAPILPFIDKNKVKAIAEGKMTDMQRESTIMLFDFIVQTNAWLQEYHVSVLP